MKWYRSLPLWFGLLSISLLVHLLLSWRASLAVTAAVPRTEHIEVPVDIRLVEKPPPEEELIFEEQIEFEPPEILVPLAAAAPPPPDVDLALRAAAGGSGGALPCRC